MSTGAPDTVLKVDINYWALLIRFPTFYYQNFSGKESESDLAAAIQLYLLSDGSISFFKIF